MRLGLVLLVALLLPYIVKGNFSRKDNENEPSEQSISTVLNTNSVYSFKSKPTGSTSKASYSSNSIFNKNGKYSLDSANFSNHITDDAYQTNNNLQEYTTHPVYTTEKTPSSRSLKKELLYKKKKLTVGYLTAARGELKERQGLAVSGALTKALEEVKFFFCFMPIVTF